MKTAWKAIILAVMLSLLTQVLKRVTDGYGIPNVVSPGRDLIIFCVFAYLLFASDLLTDRLFVLASTIMSLVLICYLFIATFEGKLFAGLYYIRVFAIPIIFIYSLIAFADGLKRQQLSRSWVFFLAANFFMLVTTTSAYLFASVIPSFKATLMGASNLEGLQDAWYISGANILRMGLPFSSPNSLGVYIALTMLVILAKITVDLKSKGHSSTIYYVLIGLNFCALAMTFSRSATLLFLLGAVVTMFNPRTSNAKIMRVGFLSIISCIALAIPILILIDTLNDGVLYKWFYLNTNMSDPSMRGHQDSVILALEKIDEYFLWGYPKGTVGPKALLFTSRYENVENSFFAIFFDMGLLFGGAFLIGYGMLLRRLYKSVFQVGILLSFLLVMQLLPYIYEYEIIIYFVFCYSLIGFLSKAPDLEVSDGLGKGKKNSSDNKNNTEVYA